MKSLLLFVISLSLVNIALAEIQTKEINYQADNTKLTGFIAWDDALKGKRPGILVVHEWWGHNDYARSRAEDLAKLGYVAFALDMYGDKKLAAHPDDAKKFMMAVMNRFDGAQTRFNAARKELVSLEQVDSTKIAAIGYCFGGGIVLNMARANADLAGVVSFHGSLNPVAKTDSDGSTKKSAENTATNKTATINVPMLVLNGADDPFVSAESISAFKQEMDTAKADYSFVNYPGVKHSFTNPGATAVGKQFDMPLEYNADADKKSWLAMQSFLDKIFK